MDNGVARVALYISPGWHDFISCIQDIQREAIKSIARSAEVYLFGHQGLDFIHNFCKGKGYGFRQFTSVPTTLALRSLIQPSILLVYTRELGSAWKYAQKVIGQKISAVMVNLRLGTE